MTRLFVKEGTSFDMKSTEVIIDSLVDLSSIKELAFAHSADLNFSNTS